MCCLSVGEAGVWREHVLNLRFKRDFFIGNSSNKKRIIMDLNGGLILQQAMFDYRYGMGSCWIKIELTPRLSLDENLGVAMGEMTWTQIEQRN